VGSEIADLEQFRLKKRESKDPYWNVACCMYCGGEFPWGQRYDHRCEEESRANHPSSKG